MKQKIILTIIFLLYSLVIIKVTSLSVINHKLYTDLANSNIHKKIYIKPIRGIIYDTNNNPIAYNELRFSLLLKPHLKNSELNDTVAFINKYINIDTKKIIKTYKKQNSWYNHKYIDVLDYIEYNKIYPYFPTLIQNKNIKIESDYLRIYPKKEILSHILGYVGKANQQQINKSPELQYIKITGKSGIEKEYNKKLTGKLGYIDVIVNARNKIIKQIKKVKPVSHNITLNIDTKLQQFIYNLFKKSNKKGTIIVMNVKGQIIAMVNYPSYDNNLFVKGISTKKWNKLLHNNFKPLLNKAISGLYPPGSVVKPAIGLIAIASGKISAYKKLLCPGYIEIGNRKFRDWRPQGHGYTDIFKAIKRSADTYFYQIGLLLGIDYISENLKRMGFGKKTGVDLPNEKRGIIPDKNWKLKRYHQSWFIGETLNASIGQGYVLVTPLQVALNTALMATGKLPVPQILKSIDNKIILPKQKDILTNKEKRLLPLIRRGMWEVCNSPGGTATKHINIPYFQIAGKTGTAQVHSIPQDVKKRKREDELAYWKRSHAWLTTYGPYKHPQFIVTAMIEHGGHGGSAAGGMVSEIYKKLVELHYIKVKGK
jgi:penicillin-binding protein 2